MEMGLLAVDNLCRCMFCGHLLLFARNTRVSTYFIPFTVSILELYSRRPTLLVRKAIRLRKETGEDRWWAPLEKEKMTFVKRVEHTLARPFKILFLEPMLLAITLYASVRLHKNVPRSLLF